MKIMFYINTLSGGGAQRVMANLANMFSENGDEVVFVTSFFAENEYKIIESVKRVSLSEKRIPSFVKRNLAYLIRLRNVIKKEKPHILVSFMRQPNFRALVASKGLPVKTIVSVRVDPKVEYRGMIGKLLAKYLLPQADGCVFQTEEAKNWFDKSLQAKSEIIPNAVKKEFYEVVRKPVPGRIVTLGRLNTQKNHLLLIDAFSDVARNIPEAELLIYGEGNLRETLESRIQEQKMENRIHLMGATSNVSDVLSEAAVFVLSSDFEGMPNALMEAMAAGVPSISTDCPCGGPAMLMQGGQNGLLVPVKDRSKLSEAMEIVLKDPEYANKLGEKSKQASKAFLPEEIFAKWKSYFYSVYDKV